MAIDINNGLPLQKHFIAVHACSQASSGSLQQTRVLIDTLTPYQIGEKAQFLRKNGTFLKNPIWRTKTKNVINACINLHAQMGHQNKETEPVLQQNPVIYCWKMNHDTPLWTYWGRCLATQLVAHHIWTDQSYYATIQCRQTFNRLRFFSIISENQKCSSIICKYA